MQKAHNVAIVLALVTTFLFVASIVWGIAIHSWAPPIGGFVGDLFFWLAYGTANEIAHRRYLFSTWFYAKS